MHILIASSPSSQDPDVLAYGLQLVKTTNARCTLTHVITRPSQRSAGRAILDMQVARARQIGLEPETELRLGQTAAQIVHLAKETSSDLVVIADSKTEYFFGQMSAPTSERVLANAPCPVLLARGDSLRQPQRILVLHGGQQTLQTLPHFLEAVGSIFQPGCQITLLHVMSQIGADYQVSGWELMATAEEMIQKKTLEGEWLAQASQMFRSRADVNVTPKVRHGLVVDEILTEVRQGEYDLIVFGRHGSGDWQDYLTDNIAEELLRGLKMPILMVPHWGETR